MDFEDFPYLLLYLIKNHDAIKDVNQKAFSFRFFANGHYQLSFFFLVSAYIIKLKEGSFWLPFPVILSAEKPSVGRVKGKYYNVQHD